MAFVVNGEAPAPRALGPAEWDAYYGTIITAFGGVPESPEEQRVWESLWETDRALVVEDGSDIVAACGVFGMRLAVPGGVVLPMAGVTGVGVRPTHHRRGLLRSMMRSMVEGMRERGEAVAGLTASEPVIYGRFGFGLATSALHLTVPRHQVSVARPEFADESGIGLRLVDAREGLSRCEEVYGVVASSRPGGLPRASAAWSELPMIDPPADRNGYSPLQCVLAEDAEGRAVGYARYAVKPVWRYDSAQSEVTVREVAAVGPAAEAALWRYLMQLDLTVTVHVRSVPTDSPLLHLLSDVRRCSPQVRDKLHVRLVDVGAALAARRYGREVDVVLEVRDGFCPWNEGRWRLVGGPDGASCERTAGSPDLTLDVRHLGSAYLGGTTLRSLADAGAVREHSEGAVARVSRAFAGDRAPWLSHGF